MDRELRVRFECVCGQMFEVAGTLTAVDAMGAMTEAMTAAHAGCVHESDPAAIEGAAGDDSRCAAYATYTPPGFSGVMSTPLTCQLAPRHRGWHEDYSSDSQRTTVYRWQHDGNVVATAREL